MPPLAIFYDKILFLIKFVFVLYILSEGIEYSDTDLIAVRIKALNPGKAKIQATVQLPGGQKISTFVEVVGK